MNVDLNIAEAEPPDRAEIACLCRIEFTVGAALLSGSLFGAVRLIGPDASAGSIENVARLVLDGFASLGGSMAIISLIAVLLSLRRGTVPTTATDRSTGHP